MVNYVFGRLGGTQIDIKTNQRWHFGFKNAMHIDGGKNQLSAKLGDLLEVSIILKLQIFDVLPPSSNSFVKMVSNKKELPMF